MAKTAEEFFNLPVWDDVTGRSMVSPTPIAGDDLIFALHDEVYDR